MYRHFIDFWTNNDGREKLLGSAMQSILDQDNKLRESGANLAAVNATEDVISDYNTLKAEYRKLTPEDFIFGFHPHPNHSVGHLHMHVFPHAEKFRQFSTKKHDFKTIPLQVILEVEKVNRRSKIRKWFTTVMRRNP